MDYQRLTIKDILGRVAALDKRIETHAKAVQVMNRSLRGTEPYQAAVDRLAALREEHERLLEIPVSILQYDIGDRVQVWRDVPSNVKAGEFFIVEECVRETGHVWVRSETGNACKFVNVADIKPAPKESEAAG